MLPQEVKDRIDAAMAVIYEFGQNRDDVMDNLLDSVSHLLDKTNEADFFEYRFEAESRREARAAEAVARCERQKQTAKE